MAWQKQPFTSLIHSWFKPRITWSLRCALQSCRQPSFPRHLFINLSELTQTLDPPMLVYSPLIPRHTPVSPATHPQKFLRSENLLLWKISSTISFLTRTRSDELLNSYIVLFAYSLQILLVSWKKYVWNFESLVLSPLSKALFFHSWAWSRTKKTSQSENRYFAQQPLGIPVICLCIYSQSVHRHQYLCSNQMSGYLPAVPNFSSLTGIKCLGSDQLFAISRLFPPPPSLYRETLRNPSQGRVLFG